LQLPDGELNYEFIKYKVGDTTVEKWFRKFENRKLKKESFAKSYPTVFTSEFDPDYKDSGTITEKVYEREYFENGRPKFLFGTDTSFSWFEIGQTESKRYKNGEVQFNKNGFLTEQSFDWREKGPNNWRNLDNSLYVQFYTNGNIKEIELVRDEPSSDGIFPSIRYTWAWNKEMDIIEYPEEWKETFPWIRFPELQLKPKMLAGLKNN
jgi:hypothetical protein